MGRRRGLGGTRRGRRPGRGVTVGQINAPDREGFQAALVDETKGGRRPPPQPAAFYPGSGQVALPDPSNNGGCREQFPARSVRVRTEESGVGRSLALAATTSISSMPKRLRRARCVLCAGRPSANGL
jgi:hypothetical protein